MIIVSATNDQYAQHLGVMLNSLFENTTKRKNIKVFIIDGNISATNKNKLNKVVGRFKKEITFLTPDEKLVETLPTNSTIGYITKETYFRIWLPALLSKKIKKILYLDCDLIVNRDITELWNINIDKHYLAAVDESLLFDTDRKLRLEEELDIPKDSSYFNAGVLLMNIEKWRREKVSRRIMKYLHSHPNLFFMDQDALNAVLHNNWLQLDYQWNYTTYHWDAIPDIEPAIIHFCGWDKPWNSDVPYKQEYLKYLHSSQWNEPGEQI